jgi:hypothetical protein
MSVRNATLADTVTSLALLVGSQQRNGDVVAESQ